MRELNFKHYSLFVVLAIVLWWAAIPGGSILLFLAWQQMAIYLWQTEFSKKSQIDCLFHSLAMLPLFFFLGAVASFVDIYFHEQSWLQLCFALVLNFIISFLIIMFGVSFFIDFNANTTVNGLYLEALKKLKIRKYYFLRLTCLFIVIALLLPWIPVDLAIIVSYALTHIMGKKHQTRLGFVA